MATVGTLIAVLKLDKKDFDKDVKSTGTSLGSLIGSAGKVGAAVVGAGAAGAAALFKMGVEAGNMADRFLDLSDITGMSTDEIQKWERVTTVAGVSADAVTNASQKLTKGFEALGKEGSKQNKALETLKVSFDDLSNMDADTRMDTMIKALSEIEDPLERAKVGTDLFGGAWKDLAPIVSLGAEAMDGIKDSANIFDNDQLKMVNDFRISIDTLKEQFGLFAMSLIMEFMPVLNGFGEWVSSKMPVIQDIMTVVFDVISGLVTGLVEGFNNYLMPVFLALYDWVEENLPAIKETFNVVFETIGSIVETFTQLFMGIWSVFGTFFTGETSGFLDKVLGTIEWAFGLIDSLVKVLVGILTGDWTMLSEGLQGIWEGLWDAITALVSAAWGILSAPFEELFTSIEGWFDKIITDAKQWGANLITGFADGIKGAMNKATDAAKDVMGGVKRFLGFNSPAEEGEGRFIEDWGSNMVEGFIDGMKNNLPMIDKALKDSIGNIEVSSNNMISNIPEDTGNTINLNIGNFIGDKYSLVKLERMLQEARQSEEGRIGGVVSV